MNEPIEDTPSKYGVIRQQTDIVLRRLYFDRPHMFIIRRGHKILNHNGAEYHAATGEIIVVSAGHFVDMTNIPDQDGLYEAEAFIFGRDAIKRVPLEPTRLKPVGHFMPPAGFETSTQSAREALTGEHSLPPTIITHRVAELLAWARAYGLNPGGATSQHLAIRLRQLIAPEPGRNWSVPELAKLLAISPPTLRRNLSSQGLSATEIIHDVRMTHALSLLQTTTTAITGIAFDVGYQSPSRFAARFLARFGVSPNDIRKSPNGK